MISFNFFGIPVRIEPWFWITLVFIGGGTQAVNAQDWTRVGLFVFAGFISILVHELGHALTVRRFGFPSAISLVAFGGFASYPNGVLGRRESFLVTLAGPAVQLALGFLVLAVIRFIPIPETSLLLILLYYLVWISIVWAVFNCLPIYPLDGGQMLSAVVGDKRRRLVHIAGIVTAVAVGISVYLLIGSWILPLYMAYFAWINWQALRLS
jgi:Zn-dependent protease